MKESKIWITEHIEQIHGEINLKKRVITIKKTIDNFGMELGERRMTYYVAQGTLLNIT